MRTIRLSFALLIGCPDPESDEASIALVVPEEGATLCGTPMLVEVAVEGLELVDPYPVVPTEPEPGTGHVDVALNGQDAFMTDLTRFELPDVGAGEWQLKVELSNADHTPIEPYAGDFVYITVDPSVCP